MDDTRFAAWTRCRVMIAAGSVMAAVGIARGDDGHAREKKKKLKFNEFGCVPIGKPCRCRGSVCCSGICEGKRPRRGERDRSRCVGHDASTCLAGQDSCAGEFIPCDNGASAFARCVITTGKASYCTGDVFCRTCARDADCPAEEFEFGAACIVCGDCLEQTACATLRTFA